MVTFQIQYIIQGEKDCKFVPLSKLEKTILMLFIVLQLEKTKLMLFIVLFFDGNHVF